MLLLNSYTVICNKSILIALVTAKGSKWSGFLSLLNYHELLQKDSLESGALQFAI